MDAKLNKVDENTAVGKAQDRAFDVMQSLVNKQIAAAVKKQYKVYKDLAKGYKDKLDYEDGSKSIPNFDLISEDKDNFNALVALAVYNTIYTSAIKKDRGSADWTVWECRSVDDENDAVYAVFNEYVTTAEKTIKIVKEDLEKPVTVKKVYSVINAANPEFGINEKDLHLIESDIPLEDALLLIANEIANDKIGGKNADRDEQEKKASEVTLSALLNGDIEALDRVKEAAKAAKVSLNTSSNKAISDQIADLNKKIVGAYTNKNNILKDFDAKAREYREAVKADDKARKNAANKLAQAIRTQMPKLAEASEALEFFNSLGVVVDITIGGKPVKFKINETVIGNSEDAAADLLDGLQKAVSKKGKYPSIDTVNNFISAIKNYFSLFYTPGNFSDLTARVNAVMTMFSDEDDYTEDEDDKARVDAIINENPEMTIEELLQEGKLTYADLEYLRSC